MTTQETIVNDILSLLEAREIFRASGDQKSVDALSRELRATYGGGYISVAMQEFARRQSD